MLKNPQYSFYGDPASQALAAKLAQHQAQMEAQQNSALFGAQGAYFSAKEQADAMRDATLYQQPGRFADTLGNVYDAYGRNSAGALGNYLNPYSQATQGYMGAQSALGRTLGDIYGAGVNAFGGMGQSAMSALGGLGANLINSASAQANARANALGQLGSAGQQAQAGIASGALGAASARDQAALGAAGQMSASANQARASADAARAAALANQSIAAANGLGQLGVAGLNMQGQLGAALSGVAAAQEAARGNAAAAQQAAGPQYARANLLAGILPGLLDTVRAGFSQPGGAVGFDASGPDGLIASGRGPDGSAGAGASGAGAGAGRFSMGPMGNFSPPPLPDFGEGLRQTRNFMDVLLDRSAAQSGAIRGDMMSEFAANRSAMGNPGERYQPDFGIIDKILAGTNYDPMRLMGAADDQLTRSVSAIGQMGGADGTGNLGGLLAGLGDNMQGLMRTAGGQINAAMSGGADGIGGYRDRLDDSFGRFAGDAGAAYRNVNAGLNGRFDQTFGGVNDLWANSLGRVKQFMSPTELAAQDIAAKRLRDQAAYEDRIASRARLAREKRGIYQYT